MSEAGIASRAHQHHCPSLIVNSTRSLLVQESADDEGSFDFSPGRYGMFSANSGCPDDGYYGDSFFGGLGCNENV